MSTVPTLQLITTRSSSALDLDTLVDSTQESLDQFIQNQNSNSTQKVYQGEVEIFFRFINHKRLEQVRTSDILSYKDFICHLRPATVGRKLSTLKSFFRFCLAEGIVDRDPTINLKLPKVSEGSPKALSIPALKRLFSVIDKRSPRGARDYAMFSLMVKGGLRRAEVRGLDHKDLELKDGFLRVHVRNGKGGKPRHVDVDLSCHDAIMDYVRSLNIEPEGPVFRAEVRGFKKTPGRISLSSINSRLKKYSEVSGAMCTVHSLRHSYSMLAEQGGAHLKDLQDSLGHSSLATTQRYIQRLNDKRNPAMDFVPSF